MRRLSDTEVRQLCGESSFKAGMKYLQEQRVLKTARTEERLFAEVEGSDTTYRVTIAIKDEEVIPYCECPAARRHPFCKHVAAVLIAWAQSPERFLVSESEVPPRIQRVRAKRTKASREEVIEAGLKTAEAFMIDLCRRGLVAATLERLKALADIEANLQAYKLRRLSRGATGLKMEIQRAIQDPEAFQIPRYAERLKDLWFTARAIRRYLEGALADERLAEDLIGKTWRDSDLEERRDLDLLELAYESRETETGFRVDASYLICIGEDTSGQPALKGQILREVKIVPLHRADLQEAPKPRYDHPLRAVRAGLYPGYPPRRIKFFQTAPCPLGLSESIAQAIEHAERSIAALWQKFLEDTIQPFSPTERLALIAPRGILASVEGLALVDSEGTWAPLDPDTPPAVQIAWMKHTPLALFGRWMVRDHRFVFQPLSLLTECQVVKLAGHALDR
ncbi:MAG: SWIM zinc finger family protein [Anaerolineae bacterium]|nr:SWIM zinc finger family protein [Anaerolineae bacterium]